MKIFGRSHKTPEEVKGEKVTKASKKDVKETKAKEKVEKQTSEVGAQTIKVQKGEGKRPSKLKRLKASFKAYFKKTPSVEVKVVKTEAAAPIVKTPPPETKTDVEKREALLVNLNALTGMMLEKMKEQEEAKKTNPNASFPEGLLRIPVPDSAKKAFKSQVNTFTPIDLKELLKGYDNGRLQEITDQDIRRQEEIEALGGYLKAFSEVMRDDGTQYFDTKESKASLHEALTPLKDVYEIILKYPEDTKFANQENLNRAIEGLINLQRFAEST